MSIEKEPYGKKDRTEKISKKITRISYNIKPTKSRQHCPYYVGK